MAILTVILILIIFFAVDIVFTANYNHYKRIENELIKEQNKILRECYDLDAKIINTDHELLNILNKINGGKINE